MQNLFRLGNTIVVDPTTRRVIRIDDRLIASAEHTAEMQAFADDALADFAEPDPIVES